jgi:hypothetical protein
MRIAAICSREVAVINLCSRGRSFAGRQTEAAVGVGVLKRMLGAGREALTEVGTVQQRLAAGSCGLSPSLDRTVVKVPTPEPAPFRGTIERILVTSGAGAVVMFARTPCQSGALICAPSPLVICPGDVIESCVRPVTAPIEYAVPVLRLTEDAKIIRAPRPTVTPDLDWIVSLLEAAPATPGLLSVADPESFAVDVSAAPDFDRSYHALNGRLLAEAVAPYWGPMDPVAGRAAAPGVKHYGKIREQRVRRSILVPYDSRVGRSSAFHGFALTGTLDIAPFRLLSARGDRLLSAAHEAAHSLEPLVGIWPEQEHLSECFADALAVLVINSRPDAALFRQDLSLYRDMRLVALLWGGSAHATGRAVAKAAAVAPLDIAETVSGMAEQAFHIAYASVGANEASLRRPKEWVEAARARAHLPPETRCDWVHLEAYRALLDSGYGTAGVRAEIRRALGAFDRIAVAGPGAALDRRVALAFKNDMAMLLQEAGTRERAHLALGRTRVALDRGLSNGARHEVSCTGTATLVELRTRLLDEAMELANGLPHEPAIKQPRLPTIVHVRRGRGPLSADGLLEIDAATILDRFSALSEREIVMLRAERSGTRARRALASASAGRLLRERVDLSLAVAMDDRQLAEVRRLDAAIADEMVRLASAPLPLLARHGEHVAGAFPPARRRPRAASR